MVMQTVENETTRTLRYMLGNMSALSNRSLLKLAKYVDELIDEEEEAEDIAYIGEHKDDPVVPFDLKDFDAE